MTTTLEVRDVRDRWVGHGGRCYSAAGEQVLGLTTELCSHSTSSFSWPIRSARRSSPVAATCASGGASSSGSGADARRDCFFDASLGMTGTPGRAS